MLVKFTTISDLHCFSRGCAPPPEPPTRRSSCPVVMS